MSDLSWKTRVLLVVTTALIVWFGYYSWTQTSQTQTSPLADVTWNTGGEPGVVHVEIVNLNGEPLNIPYIQLMTDRGEFDGPALNGVVNIDCKGTVLGAILMDGHRVFSRPMAEMLSTPSLAEGLKFKIVAKDMEVFEKLSAPGSISVSGEKVKRVNEKIRKRKEATEKTAEKTTGNEKATEE